MKKIGSLFMISVLVLAGIGIGYAGFTDTITVQGTIDTATVDINVVPGWWSGTWVWKVWGDDYDGPEVYQFDGWVQDKPTDPQVLAMPRHAGATNVELFAKSYAQAGTGGFDVDMIWDNIFPCIYFKADFIFHYLGSIPAHIKDIVFSYFNSGELNDYDFANLITWKAYRCYGKDANGEYTTNIPDIVEWEKKVDEPVDICYQLHWCNFTYVEVIIHLDQDDVYQNKHGEFNGRIEVIQWNE